MKLPSSSFPAWVDHILRPRPASICAKQPPRSFNNIAITTSAVHFIIWVRSRCCKDPESHLHELPLPSQALAAGFHATLAPVVNWNSMPNRVWQMLYPTPRPLAIKEPLDGRLAEFQSTPFLSAGESIAYDADSLHRNSLRRRHCASQRTLYLIDPHNSVLHRHSCSLRQSAKLERCILVSATLRSSCATRT